MTFMLPESERGAEAAAPFAAFWSFAYDRSPPLPGIEAFEAVRRVQLEAFHGMLKLWLLPFDLVEDAPAAEARATEAPAAEEAKPDDAPPSAATVIAFAAPAEEQPKPPAKVEAPLPPAPIEPAPVAVSADAPAPKAEEPAASAEAAATTTETAPALLPKPRGQADDLERIVGIGPKLKDTLNKLGIWHFRQIASWTPAEVAWVDDKIAFKGRIEREGWQVQASRLAKGNHPPKAA